MVKITKEYTRQLDVLLETIFTDADSLGMSWYAVAKRSGLNYSTVWRLGRMKTVLPQMRTVLLLSKAVGREVVLKGGHFGKNGG